MPIQFIRTIQLAKEYNYKTRTKTARRMFQ